MHDPGRANEVTNRLVQWVEQHPLIRALLLTSSRTNPAAPLDALSDHDVILCVTDLDAFAQNEDWLQALGRPLVLLRGSDEIGGLPAPVRLVLYDDGTKIDYSVWPFEELGRIVQTATLPEALDVGYSVLVDKDGLARELPPPTYRAHIPSPPTQQEYLDLVEEFWWETCYVAKNLWRDELMPARYSLDGVMKTDLLRRLLEWRIEIDHGWSLKPGVLGRGLKKRLDAATWDALAQTYTGPEIEENWQALFRTTGLFRRVAVEVGQALGYIYPDDLDRQMTQYLEKIRNLPK